MKNKNYGDLPAGYSSPDNSKIIILPVPYDKTSTWGKGADKGPDAIISASGNMETYDIETDSEVFLQGIFTDKPVKENSSPEMMVQKVRERTEAHLNKGKFVITLGGEHSVSIGTIYAHKDKFADITVLQLDAHSDLREEYHGSKFNHACVMARVREICPIVQVGIRSMSREEKPEKGRIFFAKDIHNNSKWIRKVLSKLSPKVYITIDLDVFDPSLLPATGTPEPGGLLWYDVLSLLKEVIKRRELIGFDVVELCPDKNSRPSDFMASKLIYQILSYKYSRR